MSCWLVVGGGVDCIDTAAVAEKGMDTAFGLGAGEDSISVDELLHGLSDTLPL